MGIVNVSHTETKWTWLQKRLQAAQAELDAIAGEIQGLENTEFDSHCAGCGEYLQTEADFAKHYIVPDPRYLNWGKCPEVLKQEAEKARAHANRVERQERTYADVVGPYKDVLHPEGI